MAAVASAAVAEPTAETPAGITPSHSPPPPAAAGFAAGDGSGAAAAATAAAEAVPVVAEPVTAEAGGGANILRRLPAMARCMSTSSLTGGTGGPDTGCGAAASNW